MPMVPLVECIGIAAATAAAAASLAYVFGYARGHKRGLREMNAQHRPLRKVVRSLHRDFGDLRYRLREHAPPLDDAEIVDESPLG